MVQVTSLVRKTNLEVGQLTKSFIYCHIAAYQCREIGQVLHLRLVVTVDYHEDSTVDGRSDFILKAVLLSEESEEYQAISGGSSLRSQRGAPLGNEFTGFIGKHRLAVVEIGRHLIKPVHFAGHAHQISHLENSAIKNHLFEQIRC